MGKEDDLIKILKATNYERFKIAIEDPSLAGVVFEAIQHDKQLAAKKPAAPSSPVFTTTPPGDTRSLTQHQGLHTLTAAEIVANARKPDPTQPYFDTNSDHMRQIDPLAPHYDFSGNFPKLVTPLKPGPKISGLG